MYCAFFKGFDFSSIQLEITGKNIFKNLSFFRYTRFKSPLESMILGIWPLYSEKAQYRCTKLVLSYQNRFSVHPFFVIGTTNLSIFFYFRNYDSVADVIGHDVIGQSDQIIETGWAILQGV